MDDTRDPHQRAARIGLVPGERWASEDGLETATITKITQTVRWGGLDLVIVYYVYEAQGLPGSMESEKMETFIVRFPLRLGA